VDGVQAAVHDLLTSPTPSRALTEYNVAMEALAATRAYLGSLQPILDVYNTLLDRSILPKSKTFATLIIVLCQRDNEVYTTINGLEGRLHVHGLFSSDHALNESLRQENDERDRERIASLKENNFLFAVKIWEALVSTWGPHQGAGNVVMAIRVFAHLECSSDGRLSVQVFLHLLKTYTAAGDIKGAEAVFNEYRRLMNKGVLIWNTLPESGNSGRLKQALYRKYIDSVVKWFEKMLA
jgi:hypothetical protein